MKFAVAVLLGFVSQTEAITFRPNPVQSPWSATPAPAPVTKISGGFGPNIVYHPNSPTYVRSVPAMFSEEKDDRLMNSLISKYATEGNTDGEGNGHFFLVKKDAMSVASEVAETHLGLTGEKNANFVKTTGEKAFAHVDQLNEGFVDIQKGPIFLRYVLDEPEVSNGLQVQLDEQMNLGEAAEEQWRPLNTIQQPWSAKPGAAPTGTLVGAYPANYGGPEEYSRVVPAKYTEESDDRLMNSLISKYALEGKTDGAPNGKFYLDKSAASAVSNEVVGSHFGFTGPKSEKFLAGKFDQLWNHYDVNNQGFIDVQRGAPFLRQILGENELANGLQLQVAGDNL